MRYSFRGILSGVDPTAWVAGDYRLRAFRDRIAAGLRGPAHLRRRQAQAMVERLLVAALDDLGTHYVEGLGRHIDEIVRIRGELQRRYQMVLGLGFRDATAIPADLSPGAFDRLFTELDTHMTALEGATPTRHLRDTPPHEILVPNVTEVADDIQRGVVPDLTSPRREPSLDPELARDMEPSGTPDRRSVWARQAEESRASRAAWRELGKALPEDPAWRAHTEAQARQMLGIPDDWQVGLQRVGPYTEPLRAQLERLEPLDPNFLTAGYEIAIARPGEALRTARRPDGVQMVSQHPPRYLFLEHKEPQSPGGHKFTSAEGRRDLRDMLTNDALLARDLESRGCGGWAYSTGQPWLDDIFALEIAELRRTQPDLGRFLTVAGR